MNFNNFFVLSIQCAVKESAHNQPMAVFDSKAGKELRFGKNVAYETIYNNQISA